MNVSAGGLANTGYIHQVNAEQLTMVQQRPLLEPAGWPHQVGVIPSRAQSFQHRAEAERLRAAVEDGGTAVLGQVLTGMGGVGKTQLAADYARTTWEGGHLDVLVWVTASDRSPVVTGFAQAGVELCRADPDDPEKAARTFLAWLTPKPGARPCRWLIVLDDVADPDDLRGLWPPASRHGRTLVTTRRRDAALVGEGRCRIEVGLFTEAEALAHLTTSLAAHGRHEPVDQLTALASELGHLPLALSQAAVYLIDFSEDVATYRELLADRATALADTTPDRLPDEQAVPLAAAWSLSLDRADSLRPVGLARPMLHLAALLDPNGIPQTILTSQPALTHLAQSCTRTGQDLTAERGQISSRDAVRALRALHRLHLIDHDPDAPHQAVRIHQLIQRAARDSLTSTVLDQLSRTVADALLAAWPDVERDTALAQFLRTNSTALVNHVGEDLLYRLAAHEVLYRAGDSLGQVGQVSAARDHFARLADAASRRLGPDHSDTLAARHHLASMQVQAGDAAGAVAAFAELLDDRVRVLGPDHPDTVATRHWLATTRGQAGDPIGAANALHDVLEHLLEAENSDHPDALHVRHLLAYWQGQAGNLEASLAACPQLVEDFKRVMGPDHPGTLAVRSDFAGLQGDAGDAAGAVASLAELLDDMVRVLGPDHPYTLTTRLSLAGLQGHAGDTAGAVADLAELLDDMVRVLGPDHPRTLHARGALAEVRGVAGNAAEAAAGFAELLDDQMRVLGEGHPDTLAARAELARWRQMAADQDVDLSTDS
ncbi:tetratricopeptide repeat protein [Streptomyces sp. NBC_00365]|uniref:tetratricopeptide repeat protein n=1 Tax=Streptomyces sp. NBC_00365 TaxID=2975726 RepID=UPI00224ECC76|nr:tetratricopeptide repeat protein [Streptomyces sp. NBC_00365]MCX5096400.1 tetratricopeptide repeat protein [Streptomyces sp. NBC_00365]